ncbi:MAG: hypothetical protein R3A45_00500 [Bdellovibrionota bacterium]
MIENEKETLHVGDRIFSFSRVNVGNPHAVIAQDHIDDIPLEIWGPAIENNKIYSHIVLTQNFTKLSLQVMPSNAGFGNAI